MWGIFTSLWLIKAALLSIWKAAHHNKHVNSMETCLSCRREQRCCTPPAAHPQGMLGWMLWSGTGFSVACRSSFVWAGYSSLPKHGNKCTGNCHNFMAQERAKNSSTDRQEVCSYGSKGENSAKLTQDALALLSLVRQKGQQQLMLAVFIGLIFHSLGAMWKSYWDKPFKICVVCLNLCCNPSSPST